MKQVLIKSHNDALTTFMRLLQGKGFSVFDLEVKPMYDNGNHRLIINRDPEYPCSWYLKFDNDWFNKAGDFVPELKDQRAESLDLLAYEKLNKEAVDKDFLLILFAHPNEFLCCSFDKFRYNKKEYMDEKCVRRYLIGESKLRKWD